MSKKIPKNKAYAFWKYDLFPCMLGGRVTEIHKGGLEISTGRKIEWITSDDYSGMSFYPMFYTNESNGHALLAEIEKLREEKRVEQARLDEKYQVLIEVAVCKYGDPNAEI